MEGNSVKRAVVVLLAVLLGIGVLGGRPADAAAARYPSYKNCTEMHKRYRGGVARVGARDKRASGHAKYRPYVSTGLYKANTRLDRDKDGIACEQ